VVTTARRIHATLVLGAMVAWRNGILSINGAFKEKFVAQGTQHPSTGR
jgi:hypothetical protein